MKPKDEAAVGVLGIIGLIAVIPLSSIFNGWVLSVIWGWFVSPLFHLPEPRIPFAIGISVITGLLTRSSCKKSDDHWSVAIISSFTVPASYLLMAWIVRFFL